MKAIHPGSWVALFSCCVVLLLVRSDLGRTSPGPLTRVHAGLGGDCAACHGSGGEGLASACGKCHPAIVEQVARGQGFHGSLAPGARAAADQCGRCHVEHHGDDAALVGPGVFALAGVPDVDSFDHAGLDFQLSGVHRSLACSACHPAAELEGPLGGAGRFLGQKSACASCHADPHDGRAPLCAACHGQERPFAELDGFEHDARFPLLGSHAALACDACHGDPRSAELVGRPALLPERGCLDCHAPPHADPALRAEQSCRTCHSVHAERFRGASLPRALHDALGLSLTAPHDAAACADCHRGFGRADATYEERFPGRDGGRCGACHADPHAGQFGLQAACLDCHERERFQPSRVGLEHHARIGFPLDGAHASAACAACHTRAADELASGARRFAGTPRTCVECHADPHAATHGSALANGASCTTCHSTAAFVPSKVDPSDHAALGFPLAGAHAAVACGDCHERPASGLPRVFTGTPRACSSCHASPHGPRFAPGRECMECHTESGFGSVAAEAFQHASSTGFALEGAHARVACAGCHAPLARSSATGRRSARARGTSCADCHADPHAGQFAETGVTRCERCHTSTESFARTDFVHDRDARFALGTIHSSSACTACHRPWPLPGGGSAVRYRPLGSECVDCHRAPGEGR